MNVCVVILVLFLMSSEQALVQASSSESTSAVDNNATETVDNKVTEAEFRSEIATGYWLGIYAITIGNLVPTKKLNIRWIQSGSDIKRDVGFLRSGNTCLFDSDNFLVTETDGEVKLNLVGGDIIERFYTQDVTKYFWLFLCFDGEDCNRGFFELLIRDTRAMMNEGEINLAGLPWDKIAADLKDIRNVTFDDINGPDYKWLGKECPLPALPAK